MIRTCVYRRHVPGCRYEQVAIGGVARIPIIIERTFVAKGKPLFFRQYETLQRQE